MSDERPALGPAAVTRALQVARLAASNRRSLTTLSTDEAVNLARVALALALAAEHGATLLQAIEHQEDTGLAGDMLAARRDLASVLLALGFVHINEEATDGQEG